MDNLTPQQQIFLKAYLDPKSPTWTNAKQSALKAGYSEEYSDNITGQMPNWLSEALGDSKLVEKALRNLNSALEGDNENIKWDATKFTLKGLKADKFSEKKNIDVTSAGERIQFVLPEQIAVKNEINTETGGNS